MNAFTSKLNGFIHVFLKSAKSLKGAKWAEGASLPNREVVGLCLFLSSGFNILSSEGAVWKVSEGKKGTIDIRLEVYHPSFEWCFLFTYSLYSSNVVLSSSSCLIMDDRNEQETGISQCLVPIGFSS